MGIGFALLVWVVIAILAVCAWSFCFAVFVVSTWKRWRAAQLASVALVIGMPLAAVALGGALAVVVSVGMWRSFQPPMVYRSEFHESPTSDVRDLQGYKFGFGDGANCYLRFTADAQTVARLIAQSKFEPMSGDDFQEATQELYLRPKYWNPVTDNPTQYYCSRKFDLSCASSVAWLSYDPKSRVVHFAWQGID